MGLKITLVVVGIALGVGVGFLIAGSSRPAPAPDTNLARIESDLADLGRDLKARDAMIADLKERLTAAENRAVATEEKNAQLEAAIAELNAPAAAAETEAEKPTGPATYADLEKALGKLGGSFQQHMFGDDAEIAAEIQKLFATASNEDVQKLIDTFNGASDLGTKTVISHFLGLSHHPMALKALEDIVRDKEQNLMDRRVASHGLAFSGAESVKPLLREMAKEDPDRGTRANSAFGLDRMGDPEGVVLYFKATDEAFREKDPVAVAYLGGLVLMGDRALPAARERLTKYTDWQAKIQLINYIQSRGDKGSLNLLSELARDESQNASVRKAAEGAIKTIEGK